MQSSIFTNKQISFMKNIGINYDFNHISDDELICLEDIIGDYLICKGFDKDYNVNEIGIMCESILDKLSEQ